MVSSEPTPLQVLDPPPAGVVRFVPLGGLREIGKNLALLECGDDVLMIDGGLRFPEIGMEGVDIILPDITFLMTRLSRLRAVVLTHGHEDHIGALPFYLHQLRVPIYGTAVTMGLLRNKLERRGQAGAADLVMVSDGQTIQAGQMSVEFIHMTHSVPGSCGLAITTPAGLVLHTGDFKLDQTPVGSEPPDLARLAELGRQGVLLLLSDSTNATNAGVTPSEVSVRPGLERAMVEAPGRVIVVTFASNLARLRQILEIADANGRRTCLVGRSMLRNFTTATRLGFLQPPRQGMLSPRDLASMADSRVCLIATGSQGEPLAALSRIAEGDHRFVTANDNDTVVLAANPIPGNESTVNRVVNQLVTRGVRVLAGSADGVHASGHGASEELAFILRLVAPRYFAPVHGEPRHLDAHRSLALAGGIADDHIAMMDNGSALEVGWAGMRVAATVGTGRVPLDSDGRAVGARGALVARPEEILAVACRVTGAEVQVEIAFAGDAGGVPPHEAMQAIRRAAQRSVRRSRADDAGAAEIGRLVEVEVERALAQQRIDHLRVLPIVSVA
ncbi:MAG: ribonuclease J [Candidatus Dormibacteria bacterium]